MIRKGNLFTKLYHVKVHLMHITISWNRTHTLIAIGNIEYLVVRNFQNIMNKFLFLPIKKPTHLPYDIPELVVPLGIPLKEGSC